VLVRGAHLRDFRSYADERVALAPGLTVVHGANGAGKTNLLEALFFGATARSCRTTNEREVVRFGAGATRVELHTTGADGFDHEVAVGLEPGAAKRITVDAQNVERLSEHPARPLVCVFLPDRLELIKGAPTLRRSHLDQFVTALWPSRAATRRAYAHALAQRNALLARVRSGRADRSTLDAWNRELATHGIALRDDRAGAVELLVPRFAGCASELGLEGDAQLRYRPRSQAAHAAELADELAQRTDADLQRGFTTHGPHRDDLGFPRGGRELRAYGSQGEQRLALLALLLAEREVLEEQRGAPPLLLLDDVMSELDSDRRAHLVARVSATPDGARGGQTVITTTDLAHVPGAEEAGVARLRASGGALHAEALAS
jgi:DNA replication and repair protein RecF